MLQAIVAETVIPVVGQDLLEVSRGGRRTLLYPLLAEKLAQRLDISGDELPPGGELQEVARRYRATSGDVQDIYRELRVILRDLDPLPIPRPLAELAEIRQFKLYVTTTFDVSMERAINEARFDGQRQTLVFSYAPNDKQDLPREFDRLNRPTVYQLMGRFSGTPHSYAVTQEDTLRFIQSLQVKTEDSPNFLFDKLRGGHLLILGSRIADWIASFFIRTASGARQIEIPTRFFPTTNAETSAGSVLFLQRFSGGTRVFRGHGAKEVVAELCRRLRELQPSEGTETLRESGTLEPGAVFLSFAEIDRAAAQSIRDALDRAGVDVLAEADDTSVTSAWDAELRGFLGEASLFLPVVSRRSLEAQRRFFRREWVDAILEARSAVPSGRFVLPVVIDDTPREAPALPGELGDTEWETLPGGATNPRFVDTVVRLQRNYRSASFA